MPTSMVPVSVPIHDAKKRLVEHAGIGRAPSRDFDIAIFGDSVEIVPVPRRWLPEWLVSGRGWPVRLMVRGGSTYVSVTVQRLTILEAGSAAVGLFGLYKGRSNEYLLWAGVALLAFACLVDAHRYFEARRVATTLASLINKPLADTSKSLTQYGTITP